MKFIMPRFFINCERWKWNNDLRLYVSNFGHVKDEHKKNVAAKINHKGCFAVYVNNHWYNVHRLVLMTWRPLPNDGIPMTVDHLDSNRRNNHLENLEWVSQEENLRRANENFTSDKEATSCEDCENFKPKKSSDNSLGDLVTWKMLEKRLGLSRNKDGSYSEEFSKGIFKLYQNGEVAIYRGNSHSMITKEELMNAVGNQFNSELLIDRFLRCSINRTGKYLGFKPWMRWSK